MVGMDGYSPVTSPAATAMRTAVPKAMMECILKSVVRLM